MVLPHPHHWISRYIGSVLAVVGLVVAATHFFMNLKNAIAGDHFWDDEWYFDPFLLSGIALCIMTAQILLLYQSPVDRAVGS